LAQFRHSIITLSLALSTTLNFFEPQLGQIGQALNPFTKLLPLLWIAIRIKEHSNPIDSIYFFN